MVCNWTGENNVRGVNFELYDTHDYALNDGAISSYATCGSNYRENIGFPGDCLGGENYAAIQGTDCPSDNGNYGTGRNSEFSVAHFWLSRSLATHYTYEETVTMINGKI